AHAGTVTTGTIAGNLSVNSTGAAVYSMPIEVPPGVSDMQPTLAISYKSGGSNGLLGKGAALSGFSVIHRCGATIAQDNFKGGIYLDARDRYCLDGQRLIAIAGEPGAAGSEYRTEIEGYSKIVANGQQGVGPTSWTVWTKSGKILEYGVSEDSRIELQGSSSVRVWALNKRSDSRDNSVNYHYIEDSSDGSYRPDRIDYTENAAQGVLPGLSIRFEYETRPDTVHAYLAGSQVTRSRRLQRIGSYVGEQLVTNYTLSYESRGNIALSYLTSVTLCDAAVSCLPATTFSYPSSQSTLFSSRVASSPRTSGDFSSYKYHLGDFNGDGLRDLVWTRGTSSAGLRTYVALANGDGTFQSAIKSSPRTTGNFSDYKSSIGD
ncbi:MAG: hypothetical protein GY753_05295, partial [Gammaproteobacteria bacterium]|nr:hypothetical protein [Gammaproteobacteria bacterium]